MPHRCLCILHVYCAAYRIKYNQLEFTQSLKHTLFPFHCHHHSEYSQTNVVWFDFCRCTFFLIVSHHYFSLKKRDSKVVMANCKFYKGDLLYFNVRILCSLFYFYFYHNNINTSNQQPALPSKGHQMCRFWWQQCDENSDYRGWRRVWRLEHTLSEKIVSHYLDNFRFM